MATYQQRSGSSYYGKAAIKKSGVYRDDFIKIMTKKLTTDLSDAELEKAFRMIDRDGSGKIDASEFETVLKGIGCNFYP